MAHECPNCYMRCHCGGDIDDCEFEGTPEQMNCTHCNQDDWDDDEDDWDEQENEQPECPFCSCLIDLCQCKFENLP